MQLSLQRSYFKVGDKVVVLTLMESRNSLVQEKICTGMLKQNQKT